MCKICKKNSKNLQVGKLQYAFCDECCFLEKMPNHFLSDELEMKRYQLHDNDGNNEYIKYQKKFAEEIMPFLGNRILDFGCGESHTLATILNASYYDKFFYPNRKPLESRYDSIILEEVIEHLKEPLEELMDLSKVLNDSGNLIIRTRFLNEDTDLSNWWYLRDQTHVCFFSYQTFEKICELLNLRIIYCNDVDLIILQKV